jgi:RNAse (barnase) inhibitor barstar
VTAENALPVLEIDGERFDDLEGFAREFSRLLGSHVWHGNLDAFNDILRGGFGTPDQGFLLRWLHSDASRRALGWDATVQWLEQTLTT